MKLRDLEFTESLGQSQIIGGIDENKVNVNLDLDIDLDIGLLEGVIIIDNSPISTPRTVVEASDPIPPLDPDNDNIRLLIAGNE
ncbi:MAG: hypothetical protein WBA77_04805 [Microcoleaceae cyanobacterium]